MSAGGRRSPQYRAMRLSRATTGRTTTTRSMRPQRPITRCGFGRCTLMRRSSPRRPSVRSRRRAPCPDWSPPCCGHLTYAITIGCVRWEPVLVYTAGLLCERLGSSHVTTVDIDPALVHTAAARLTSIGYHPTAITGNGADGYPSNAPYDRFLATCALRRIPSAWLAQAASGARIVAPIAKGLITLDVQDANHAAGRFLAEGGYFMPLRDSTDDGPARVTGCAKTTAQNHSRRTTLGPRDAFYHQHMRFLLTLVLPDVSVGQHGPALDDLIIRDHAGSSARLCSTHDGSFLVTETGSRALWAEVEQVHHLWHDCHQPRRERFGFSVAHERQWVWLDSPDSHHIWELPT
jgi:Protein-L-isoaspartate(D-aspartate) O-methyltransferase (PCMT)